VNKSSLFFFIHIHYLCPTSIFFWRRARHADRELSAQWMSRLYFLFLIYTYFFFPASILFQHRVSHAGRAVDESSLFDLFIYTHPFFFPTSIFFWRRVSHAARAVGAVDESSAFSRAKFHGALFWNHFAFRCAEVGLFDRFFFLYIGLFFNSQRMSRLGFYTRRVAVCCRVLQRVADSRSGAVCCSVLQCVVVCCSVLQCVVGCCSVLQSDAVCCSVWQCVCAVCCSV